MIKAIVEIDDVTNEVIDILKAQYGLSNKSQAINEMAKQYKEIVLDSEVRPEFFLRLKRVEKEQVVRVGKVEVMRKRYGLK